MKKSKIEWTEETWNPTIGCTKISSGCKFCYAEVMAKRLKAMGVDAYKDAFKFKMLPDRLDQPLNKKKPTKYFVNSMSDLFHQDMETKFLDSVMTVIRSTPRHTYQILTKRDDRMVDYFKEQKLPKNIWLGVTVEDKKNGLKRIDSLRKIKAEIKFLSIEPLLEDLGEVDFSGIDWVIVGGESGAQARPMKESWVLKLKEQCEVQGSLFFFKQWGTWGADQVKRNKKKNGRLLLGKTWDAQPEMEFV